MNKQYRLKKDSPCDKAGCIFQWDNESGAYMGVLLSNSQYTADVVENNPEWFENVPSEIVFTLSASAPFNESFKLFMLSCDKLGIKYNITPTEGEAIDLLSAKGFTILTSGEDWVTKADLEKCWNAARMKDPFDRSINQKPKYTDFKDYMDRKPK